MKFHFESVVRSGHPREFRVLSELLHQRQQRRHHYCLCGTISSFGIFIPMSTYIFSLRIHAIITHMSPAAAFFFHFLPHSPSFIWHVFLMPKRPVLSTNKCPILFTLSLCFIYSMLILLRRLNPLIAFHSHTPKQELMRLLFLFWGSSSFSVCFVGILVGTFQFGLRPTYTLNSTTAVANTSPMLKIQWVEFNASY